MTAVNHGWMPLAMTARDWLILAFGQALGMAIILPWLPVALWPP
jgi:hypothetical protein